MSLGFVPSKKNGQHYELAMFALKKMRQVNLALKGRTEKHFEFAIVSALQQSLRLRKSLIAHTGVDEVETITRASLFSFGHWPDVSIGNDGTAIEIKVIQGGPGVRDILGQAIAYRMHYRFVILVLVDQTQDRRIVTLCQNKQSQEHSLLTGIAEDMSIFTVVGPVGKSKNIAFSGESTSKRNTSEPTKVDDGGRVGIPIH